MENILINFNLRRIPIRPIKTVLLINFFLILFVNYRSIPIVLAQKSDSYWTNENHEKSQSENKMIEIIDDAGRKVEIPKKIETVLGTGPASQVILYSIIPERLLGWNSKPTEEELEFLPSKASKLQELGSLFAKGKQISIEEVITLNPDVIIDLGTNKPNLTEDLDKLQEDSGIPVLFFESELDDLPRLYEKFQELFQVDTSQQSQYLKNKLTLVIKNRNKIYDDNRKYYLGSGDNGLKSSPAGSFQTLAFDYLGMKNVLVDEQYKGGGWQDVSAEQLIEWDPDLIVFHPNSGFQYKDQSPWNMTKAYQNGQIYEIPSLPFNWLAGSVNRVLGLVWLGNLVYPDLYPVDIINEMQEFYKLFYHYDLSEDDAKILLKNANKNNF